MAVIRWDLYVKYIKTMHRVAMDILIHETFQRSEGQRNFSVSPSVCQLRFYLLQECALFHSTWNVCFAILLNLRTRVWNIPPGSSIFSGKIYVLCFIDVSIVALKLLWIASAWEWRIEWLMHVYLSFSKFFHMYCLNWFSEQRYATEYNFNKCGTQVCFFTIVSLGLLLPYRRHLRDIKWINKWIR